MRAHALYLQTLTWAGDRRLWSGNWAWGHAVLYLDPFWMGWPYRRVRATRHPLLLHSFNLWPLHLVVARHTEVLS